MTLTCTLLRAALLLCAASATRAPRPSLLLILFLVGTLEQVEVLPCGAYVTIEIEIEIGLQRPHTVCRASPPAFWDLSRFYVGVVPAVLTSAPLLWLPTSDLHVGFCFLLLSHVALLCACAVRMWGQAGRGLAAGDAPMTAHISPVAWASPGPRSARRGP